MLDFFINRPIFAATLAMLMVICGAVSMYVLPIAQFPNITPPTVVVSANYPGASAAVTAESVTTVLEEQINGIQGMIYLSSTSANNGACGITATFEVGYDLDIGAVDVQNRVSQAASRLPPIVEQGGVVIEKASTDMVVVVSLTSPNGTYDDVFLGNYADIHITDPLARVPGVGSTTNFGLRQYAMRIWLDPDKMAALSLTVSDVINAVNEQNQQVAAGLLGAPPTKESPAFQLQVSTQGLLVSPIEFENIVVRTGQDGSLVKLSDIGRVELGAQSYQTASSLNGVGCANIAVYQLPGSNALNIRNRTQVVLEELAKKFPDDVQFEITYDTTEAVRLSIEDLVVTLLEALGLVVLVVFVFLQSWRATLIPIIAIPVSLVGAFSFMMLFGFSINTLTLLGLVLAVGLVVDDAIVVVENVERQLDHHPTWTRRQATSVAMHEVVGPIFATTLVLLAVFIPTAFMPGITGQLYNQFALTIAFSVMLSSVNSLTLSPALCGILLKPKGDSKPFILFRWFNTGFDHIIAFYGGLLHWLIRLRWLVVIGFLALGGLTAMLLMRWPTAFVPNEDQGYCFGLVILPPASTSTRTDDVVKDVVNKLKENPWVENVVSVTGYNFLTSTGQTYAGFVIPVFKPWGERGTKNSADSLVLEFNKMFKTDPSAEVQFMSPPAVQGLSPIGGFQLQVENLAANDYVQFYEDVEKVIEAARKDPRLMMVQTPSRVDIPQLWLDVDREKAKVLGINLSSLFQTLQVQLGSLYINNFNLYGRVYQVQAQAEGWARSDSTDIGRLYVRNSRGESLPVSTVAEVRQITGPDFIPHYNLYETIAVMGSPNAFAGASSSDAVEAMEEICDRELSNDYGYEWTGTTFQELQAGNLAPIIFSLALIVVFLLLAAQYESWMLPMMIMLTVPLAVLGAMLALMVAKRPLDVYGQIGLVMLIGLAAKNAILIVEFAKELRADGADAIEAAVEAAKLRLRPILMTAFAFIFGVIPLVLATGAGAQSRISIGTVVLGGMLMATVLSLGIVPVFFVIIERLRELGGVDPTMKIGPIDRPTEEGL